MLVVLLLVLLAMLVVLLLVLLTVLQRHEPLQLQHTPHRTRTLKNVLYAWLRHGLVLLCMWQKL
jgi:hypothetical protein